MNAKQLESVSSDFRITPQQFGAKADYNFSTKQGTDDSQAFIDAIAAAISAGYQEVYVPAGNYLVTKEINLGGDGRTTREGVRLRGANWNKSQIIFKAKNDDDVCISFRGSPGTHTSKALSNICINAHADTMYKGIGLLMNNVCFGHVDEFLIVNMKIGIRIQNSGLPGHFTEFNYFKNGRLFRNAINIQFYRNGGDESFHGNNFENIQNQIMPNGGVGIQVNGESGVCYLYNQYWQMQIFGGTGCVAIELVKCNTDYIGGKLTGESSLIFRSDSSSRWDFHGEFNSISHFTFDCPNESPKTGGRFVFENVTSLMNTPMTNSANRLPVNSRFLPFAPSFADKNGNGIFPSIFHIKSSDIESLGLATYNQSGNSFYFGHIAYNSGIIDFIPTFWFDHDGSRLTTAAKTYNLNLESSPSNAGTGYVFSDTTLRPKQDSVVDLGSNARKFRNGFFSGRISIDTIPVTTMGEGIVKANDTGTIGQMRVDKDTKTLFVCIATNQWKKISLADI
ncbi:TPA: hypothetical protein QHX44_000257 [Klebsiella oxytoca]|nr:hypothetical protein [Klebsiella oxytoca]